MGRRGPLPKADRTRNDRVPVVTLAPAPVVPPPPAPAGLLAVNRRRWEAYFAADVARALVETDLPAVDRLFHYYDLWERARRSGDTAEMVKVERPIVALEASLGLTPSARARLGIQVGQAKKLSLESLRESLR
jgi:hypothetical protein